MARNIKSRTLISTILIAMFIFSETALAQANRSDVKPSGPRQQLAVIIFSGLGGAVLGLSTLSFYGRPQDHLNNIAIGFAVGVIGGTIFTTYRTATRPYYDSYRTPSSYGFWRDLPSNKEDLSKSLSQTLPMTLSYNWTF